MRVIALEYSEDIAPARGTSAGGKNILDVGQYLVRDGFSLDQALFDGVAHQNAQVHPTVVAKPYLSIGSIVELVDPIGQIERVDFCSLPAIEVMAKFRKCPSQFRFVRNLTERAQGSFNRLGEFLLRHLGLH